MAKEVWRQIESFSGYSFSKAHSASFAVESYQSLYLKTYFPLEFMVAVINNFGGFYSTEFYIHEARRYGALIEAPEINESDYLTRIEGNVIWLGWIHIKSLENKLIEGLLQERNFGHFTSFSNFVSRISIGLEQLIILIRIGAFRNFGTPKKELLWEAHFRYNSRFQPSHYKQTLFGLPEPETYHLPALVCHPLEDAYDQIELLGFSISSPFELVAVTNSTSTTGQNLVSLVGRNIKIYGYLVTWKPVRTKNHKLMGFGYFLDEKGEFFDTTHFPPSLEKYPFRGRGVYCLDGKVVEEFGFPSLEVSSMQKLEVKADPRSLEMTNAEIL